MKKLSGESFLLSYFFCSKTVNSISCEQKSLFRITSFSFEIIKCLCLSEAQLIQLSSFCTWVRIAHRIEHVFTFVVMQETMWVLNLLCNILSKLWSEKFVMVDQKFLNPKNFRNIYSIRQKFRFSEVFL